MKSSGSGAAKRPAPAVKEAAFGHILRETNRSLKLRQRLVSAADFPGQVGANGMEQVARIKIEIIDDVDAASRLVRLVWRRCVAVNPPDD
jgi:hypothetical protein